MLAVVLVTAGFYGSIEVHAWSRTGHMSIAAMAYRNLPDSLQHVYTNILRLHRDFASWNRDYQRLNVSIDLGEYLFMRASVWPDDIRRSGSSYDHPTWHYTNFPVTPPAFELTETLTPENDVLYAIQLNQELLANQASLAVDRAAALSWLLHVIGDIHQPLHAVALVSEDYPNGDRGGNDFFVRPSAGRQPLNLHAFWDGLLGTTSDIRTARNQATLLLETYGTTDDLSKTGLEPRDWALEGRIIAIDDVYRRGSLAGVSRDRRESAHVLPEDYAARAKAIAEERAVIASKRTAAVLKTVGSLL